MKKSHYSGPRAVEKDILRAFAQRRTLSSLAELAGLLAPDGGIELDARVQRLVRAGLLRREADGGIGLMDSVRVVEGGVTGHADGYGFVRIGDREADAFLHHREMKRVLHGDTILALVVKLPGTDRCRAQVLAVVDGDRRELVGTFQSTAGAAWVIPNDARFGRNISVIDRGEAANGDVVALKISEHPFVRRQLRGRVTRVLGREGDSETEQAIISHGLPTEWSAEVLHQLEAMPALYQAALDDAERKDLRRLAFVTIDGSEARDFDDAVYARAAGTGFKLFVAIADVSHFIASDTALDRAALERGTSVYFPRRVIPMLPEVLSNELCSLQPGPARAVMVCEMAISKQGEVGKYQFYPAIIRSQARLTYAEVQRGLDAGDIGAIATARGVGNSIRKLYAVYTALRKRRQARGALDFELPQAVLQFDQHGEVTDVCNAARHESCLLIEECMLAANVCAAKQLAKKYGERGLYRNHEGPDADALHDLRAVLGGIGLDIGEGTANDYSALIKFLDNQKELAATVQLMLLRSLSQARYENHSRGHFALAYPVYTHFTSPIRRYGDLVVHRLLKAALLRCPVNIEPEAMAAIGAQCSGTERRAEEAVFEVQGRLKARFMRAKLGQTFGGVITGVKEFGVFVWLDDYPIDGLVHISTLGDDYFDYDPTHMTLVGRRRGQRFQLGDRVQVVVTAADTDSGKMTFQLSATTAKRQRRASRR